jgi:ArsR family transcriptional regulator
MIIDTIKIELMKNLPCSQDGPQPQDDLRKVTEFLRIINEPNRLKILCFLRRKEQCVCDIWQNLDLPQNLASHHLKILKEYGLIESRQEGRKIIYRSNKEVARKATALLNNFLTSKL